MRFRRYSRTCHRAAITASRSGSPRASPAAMALASRQPVPRASAGIRGAANCSIPEAVASTSTGSPARCPPFRSTASGPPPSSFPASAPPPPSPAVSAGPPARGAAPPPRPPSRRGGEPPPPRWDRPPPAPGRPARSPPSSIDQGPVQRQVLASREELGVPLHAERELVGQLDGLDDLIRRDGANAGPTRVLHCLMMGRVHLDLALADDRRQLRAGDDARLVPRLARVVALLVIERAWHLVADVLEQRAAQLDREQLHAAADAEHGHVSRQRRAQDTLLERRPAGFQGTHPRARLRSIELGGNVERPSRDHP